MNGEDPTKKEDEKEVDWNIFNNDLQMAKILKLTQ